MLCAKRYVIEFRLVSSIYLQNFMVGQQLEQELLANFKWLLKMETGFYTHCMWHFCVLTVLWKGFFVGLVKSTYKTMRKMSSLGFRCTLLIIITTRQTLAPTGLVQQPSFWYWFQAICCEFGEFKKCQRFVYKSLVDTAKKGQKRSQSASPRR